MKIQRTILLRALASLTLLAVLASAISLTLPGRAAPAFNYAEALQKTILFYEAQRSGRLSTSSIPTRFTWRGDSQLTDGQAQGIDLTGGMVDAGDNMKYTFPMAQAMQMLAWGAVENRQAYVNSGQLSWLLNQLRWGNDWFIKAHPSANVLYHQVGFTASDHNYWIPIESTQYHTDSRSKAYKVDTSCPGSDVAADVAGAMATASIVFRPTDPAYADTLLTHAEQLYSFADTYRGRFSDCIIAEDPDVYRSWSGYDDELVWDAIWLYKAKEAKQAGSGTTYLDKARAYYPNLGLEGTQPVRKYKWSHVWDDKTFGSYVMMAKLTPSDPQYQADAERWLNWWTVGGTEYGADGSRVTYTPGGHARVDNWGSLRYAANTSFIAFVYSDWLKANNGNATKIARYHDFAVNQVNYILGQNPRNCSYIGGFGNCPPEHPHHRTAHGAWNQQQANPAAHRHILYGALSGSPGTDDSFVDTIADAVSNEVALDYNAGISSALARMYQEFGGTPLPDSSFPLPDKAHTCKDEWGIFITYYSNGSSGIGPLAFVENRSSWPARATDKLKFRYFFTLDAANISDITASATGATVSGPTLWDAANKVYYFTFDATGTMTYPGYSYGPAGPEVSFTISSNSATWNSANDWSFQNIDSTYTGGWGSNQYAGNIPVYEGASNTKLCGAEPGGGGNTPQPTNTPTRTNTPSTPVVTNTNTPTVTRTNTPSTPVLTPTRTRTATSGPSPTRTRTPTTGPTSTRTNTPVITNTPTGPAPATATRTSTPTTGPSLTATPTPTSGVGACSPVTSTITAPFTFDGAGTFCWQSSNLGAFVNSWNTTSVTINGVNITNVWMGSGSYPAQIGGFWYISYNSSVAWGHFEAK